MDAPAAIDVERLKVELEEYGFVVIPNLIPRDQALTRADRLMAIMRRRPSKETARPTQNLGAVFNHLDQADYPSSAR